jgi:hypothetical protein
MENQSHTKKHQSTCTDSTVHLIPRSSLYMFNKRIYKRIRNWVCNYLYGEYLPETELVERRRDFIMKLKGKRFEVMLI